MKLFSFVIVLAVCLSYTSATEVVTKQTVDGKTIATYVDADRNYTKRVVHDVLAGPTTYATQSVSVTTDGAFVGTAYLYAARTDNMVTITFKALTGTVSSVDTLYIRVAGTLNEEFFPKDLGYPEYKAGWAVYVTDGGDQIGKMFWYGCEQCFEIPPSCIQWGYFRVYGVNGGNFGTGSGRGYDRDISISFRRY
jgi:hypothetical protein